ncbi:MAG TPA: ribosome-associated translation inhibitor RaiA [Actinomycetota bacterium]|jgi:ribosomal subunit interface protein|nr:ribosome-associated translation inhibitor RaiA [Actinomycetota bacterium]
MEVFLKGRGLRITAAMRNRTETKLAKLGRIDPRVTRVEVEVILERNPRIDGSHRVDVACARGPRVIRAHAAGQDLDGALDQVIERLERRLTSRREKLRDRRHSGPMV